MSDSPVQYSAPPQLGQQTSEVLAQWALMTPMEIESLYTAGVVEGR